jgi:lysozyme
VIDEATPIACALARPFEGLRLRPYLCPAGIPSIGYGATYYLDGRPVTLNDPPISREAAERLLVVTMARVYVAGALRLCPTVGTARRLAGLGDFGFNLGLTRLKASTLRKRVLAGDWLGARAELSKWTRGGGRVLPGLVRRRAAEAATLE